MILTEEIIAVLIGGALGSLLRFLLSQCVNAIMPKNFPWGILFVNILGCFMIGFLSALLAERWIVSPFWRAGIFIGLLGGLTTFSSFSLDTVSLFQMQAFFEASLNIVVSVLFSIGATILGIMIANILV